MSKGIKDENLVNWESQLSEYLMPDGTYFLDNASCKMLTNEEEHLLSITRKKFWGNTSATHGRGRATKEKFVESTRHIATELGVHYDGLIINSGATESLGLVVYNVLNIDGGLCYPEHEHPAILSAIKSAENLGKESVALSTNPTLDEIEEALKSGFSTFICSHIHSELGLVRPLKQIAELTRKYHGKFICDITQSFGKVSFEEYKGCDVVLASVAKFSGLLGCGFVADYTGLIQDWIIRGTQDKRAGSVDFAAWIFVSKLLTMKRRPIDWRSRWTFLNKKLLQDKGCLVDVGPSCGWILNVNLPLPFHQGASKKLSFSKGAACQEGVLSGAYQNCYKSPENIIRLSF